jgi:hypothetical protein
MNGDRDDELPGGRLHEQPPICRQVWDHAVEGRDVMGDAGLAAHVGSCVTCFRVLAELRDAPRLAAALRADAEAPAVPDRFWDDLAVRTSAAAAREMASGKRRGLRIGGFVAVVAAAAAAWVLVGGRAPGLVATTPPGAVTTAVAEEDEAGEETVDVADLDESALRRLLDRLRARAPVNLHAFAAVSDDASDPSFDDDGQINDELAELDGPALLRIERSLAGAAL